MPTVVWRVAGAAGMILLAVTMGGMGPEAAPSSLVPLRTAALSPAGTPSFPAAAASPTRMVSPAASPLPLYTPIPVNAAVNVVGRLTLELTDRGFIPSRFECAVNEDIVVTLVNTGIRLHTFSIDELDVDVPVAPGQTVTVTMQAPPRLGHYTYSSTTPEDRTLGMMGTMTIFI